MGALLSQFMNKYAYTDFHELNADWLIKTLMEMINQVENFVSLNAIKYADPIQWDIVRQYEKNTIVIDPLTGTAYISVQPVPSGVALTRTEYWTVVFDLGSFVVRAAKNFTNRYEADTTLTATFPSSQGNWLVWGDVLYEVIVPTINAGDQYVVGSNIRHITMEEVVDALAQAIQAVQDNVDTLDTKVGDLADLNTSVTTSVVLAINSVLDDLNLKIGDLANLTTTDKSSVVNAINELDLDIHNFRIKNVLDYGAKGDGVTDDTTAIQSWLNDLNSGDVGFIPAGTYITSATLTAKNIDDLTIIGTDDSIIMCTFADGNIINFGGSPRKRNLTIDGLRIDSSVAKTSGAAIYIKGYQNYSRVHNIRIGKNDGNPSKIYNGIIYEQINVSYLSDFVIDTAHHGLTVSGENGSMVADSSDLFVEHGIITNGYVNIHVAGGFGGLYLDNMIVFGGYMGYLQDNAICPLPNREIMIGNTVCFDGSWDALIAINEPNATNADIININAFLSGAGYYAPADMKPTSCNIRIANCANGFVNIANCTIKSATGIGIFIGDATTKVMIDNSCMLYDNATAVYNGINSTNVYCDAVFLSNTQDFVGQYNPSIAPLPQPYTMRYNAAGNNTEYWNGTTWTYKPNENMTVHYSSGNNELAYYDHSANNWLPIPNKIGNVKYDAGALKYWDGSAWQNV